VLLLEVLTMPILPRTSDGMLAVPVRQRSCAAGRRLKPENLQLLPSTVGQLAKPVGGLGWYWWTSLKMMLS
jgi:hypothetical protein